MSAGDVRTIPLRRMVDHVHGWVRYSVTGPRGAVNLTFGPPDDRHPLLNRWSGVDFGYHSPRAMYEGQEPMEGACELLGEVECYYDGSGLAAERYVHLAAAGDADAIYAVLEADYFDRFTS